MSRRYDIVLEEILESIDLAQGAISGLSTAMFAKDVFRQRGIERTLEIISEAVRHLSDEMLATQVNIRWSDVRAIGNLIRHEYWRVDSNIVWRIVEDDLPALREAVTAISVRVHDMRLTSHLHSTAIRGTD
ncbi:MAG: HepT-like ribonuclease domain-containing protein [Beijerinckiaceae bacterium]